jgi:carbon monoxide dehydrogenase subunit G
MRVGAHLRIAAAPELVWEIATDPTQALDFLAGVTRWELAGGPARGLGARYRMLMRVRAAELGGLVEVVEWRPPLDFAWTSVTGIDQRGRLRLRATRAGQTSVEFRLAYGVAGAGLSGLLAERIAAPTVAGNLRASLRQLRRLVEHEQRRARAAGRSLPAGK